MMRWIIGSSLKLRLVVATVAGLLMVFGFATLRHTPTDVFPEFSRPYVEIQTEALGLSAQEVEALITTPLEADMLNGTPWVSQIRSMSLPGLSSIILIFEKGTDIMRARQMVQERLTQVFLLPQVSKPPVMINPVSSASRVMAIGLTSDKLSLIDLSVLARWTIAPKLMGLPGVANVSIWGRRERQLQVQVDPEKLREQRVTLMQVIKTAGNALWASPLSFLEASTPGTGGWVDTPNQRLGVRHVQPITKPEHLARVPIEGTSSKRLGEVATVTESHQPLIGDAIVKDAPALMLVVEKFPWANTTDVTHHVEKALSALQPGLSGVEMDPTLFRPATFLEMALANLGRALLVGAALVILVLLAFLSDWRTALIGTAAILSSAIAAGTVLYVLGVPVNLMIVTGLMIALGVVIDDAIVGVENIVRRLRHGPEAGNGNGATGSTIIEAVSEMRRPLLYATLILMLAVAPAVFLTEVSGALFRPLAAAYLLALLASFVVALTVTPALSLLFLRNGSLRRGDSPVAGMLRGMYTTLFGWAIRTPRTALAVVCAVVVVGLLPAPFLRLESLLPDFKETDLVVRWEGGSSASHPAMDRIATLASRELRSIPGVRNVSAHVGRAVMSDRQTNINSGELWVSIHPSADYAATVAAVKRLVGSYPGPPAEVLTNLQAGFRHELSGTGQSLVVRVYGDDMNILRQKAEEVQKVLASTKGAYDARVQYPQEMPTLEIEVNLEKAKHYGLKPGDVRRAATSLISGIHVGNLFEEQKVFEVMVYGTPNTRHSLTSIENLLIDTPSGGHVPLKEVAEVRIVPAVTVIHRDAAARRMDVTASVHGRDLASVGDEVEDRLKTVEFPLEYRAELLGEYAERDAAEQRVATFAIAAAIGVLLILQAFFRSWRLATVMFLTFPAALAGGVLAAFFARGGLLSLGSIVGSFTVLGIAVRQGITLISHYRHLEHEGETFGAELVQRCTQERCGPILMTAGTTGLAFMPFLLFGNIAGLEILHPVAIVVLGSLVTATMFTLAGVPAIYLLFGRVREPALEFEEFPVGAVSGAEMRKAAAAD
jgi:CzcA family heavy metal efflux pump